MALIPFAEWAPDLPDFGAYAREASGVIAEGNGYRPFRALATTSNALTARAQGAAWFRRTDGTMAQFAGDATKLYLLASATWGDASRTVGGAYATATDGNWRFMQFGSLAIAANGVDALQKFDLAAGTNWAALGGSPPIGTFLAGVRDFVVTGKIGSTRQRVQWSPIFNAEGTWGSDATTQADYQDLPDGGDITGLTGGEFGVILQEAAVRRMTYEGSPTVFRIDKIVDQIGATIPNSVAGGGSRTFFCHRTGFYMLVAGQQLVPIGVDEKTGDSKVNRWFWSMLDQTNMHRVTAAIDPLNSLYIVSFPASGSSGTPNAMLIYNYLSHRWSRAVVTCEMIYSGATQQSYTLEQLDAFGTLETLPYSLDSSYWTGARNLLLCGFYTDHKWGAFAGAALAATIDTGEAQATDGRRSTIRSVRPIVDGGSPTVSLGWRNTQQEAVTWDAARSMTANGMTPQRRNSRYARFRTQIPAGATWTWAQGIDDVDTRAGGLR